MFQIIPSYADLRECYLGFVWLKLSSFHIKIIQFLATANIVAMKNRKIAIAYLLFTA